MFNWLFNPDYNYATSWGITLFFAALSLLTWVIYPEFSALISIISVYLGLSGWRWYYSEWVENSLYEQSQETLGTRAIFLNLRLATFGAAAAILVFLLFFLALKRDVTAPLFLFVCGVFVAAVPISLVSLRVKVLLTKFLKEVCEVPFNFAIVWMAATTEECFLDSRYKTLNKRAKNLLAIISGYSSNLSVLHEADYIASQFPKWR